MNVTKLSPTDVNKAVKAMSEGGHASEGARALLLKWRDEYGLQIDDATRSLIESVVGRK